MVSIMLAHLCCLHAVIRHYKKGLEKEKNEWRRALGLIYTLILIVLMFMATLEIQSAYLYFSGLYK